MTLPTEDAFDRLPKVELHVHLEGSIPLPTLWQLVEKYRGTNGLAAPQTLAELEAKFAYRDFPHFIDTWVWKNQFIREADDFRLIAAAVARDFARQRIRYAEVIFSPSDFYRTGVSIQAITEAVRSGVDEVQGVRIQLVADLVRDMGPNRSGKTLSALAEVLDRGVVGITLGGSEHRYPPEPYAEVYHRARQLGLRTSAHAGEAAGAASIWGALNALEVDRLGHATRIAEDPELFEVLAARGVAVEACPISNLRTGAIPNLDAHPLRELLAASVVTSVNTDDPAMFHTSLAAEYRALSQTFGFELSDIAALIQNAVASSWLDEADKLALSEALRAEPGWPRP